MKSRFRISLWLLISLVGVSLLAPSCGRRERRVLDNEPPPLVKPQGGEETLEIATWNIETFPLAGETTVDEVQRIIEGLDIDLFAVQEISDTVAFRELLDGLPEYNGLYSKDSYGDWYQKTGVIYKEGLISIENVGQIFTNDRDTFPRPPLEMSVVAQKGGERFDFRLLVLHLKAGPDSTDLKRRREAAKKLKAYLDSQIASSEEKDFVVAGDWNDQINDPPGENAFTVFIEDSLDYRFLTFPLAGDPHFASYPRYSSLIDHILISKDAIDEYRGGTTTTLRLDDEVVDYFQNVSDHRPVMAKFPVFIASPEESLNRKDLTSLTKTANSQSLTPLPKK